jgi:hypothetical protein
VWSRQFARTVAVFQRDFQGCKSVTFDFFGQRIGRIRFAQRFFDGNFPNRNRADEDVVFAVDN